MLVLTRKNDEEVTFDNWLHVVATEISKTQTTIQIHAARPFQAVLRAAAGSVFPEPSTCFKFILSPDESILIGDKITVIFIVARIAGPNLEPRARIGFEAPLGTRLYAKDAHGKIVTDFEFGQKLQKK